VRSAESARSPVSAPACAHQQAMTAIDASRSNRLDAFMKALHYQPKVGLIMRRNIVLGNLELCIGQALIETQNESARTCVGAYFKGELNDCGAGAMRYWLLRLGQLNSPTRLAPSRLESKTVLRSNTIQDPLACHYRNWKYHGES
jgi:hypothetical protein